MKQWQYGMSEKKPWRLRRAPGIDRILSVLNRDASIDALPSLVRAVKSGPHSATLSSSAIIIDANAILRIPSQQKNADIIDYITGIHTGPVILPGQVVQEFWNNQASVATTIYAKIKSKHSELVKEIERAQETVSSETDEMASAVAEFKVRNDHVFDAELVLKTSQFLERLMAKAKVPFAPRTGLDTIASHRKRAKTPPGFEDNGDGDFLVWVDALFGLSKEQRRGSKFTHVIMLTDDKKIDWCRGQTAHPILHAEMKAILGVDFEVWNLKHFSKVVADVL